MDKQRISSRLAKYAINPVTRLVAGYVPWWALVETRGRKTGRPRRTPVGNGLEGDTFWIVSEHGRKAGYVRNLETDPRVRVRVNRRWRTGVAHVLPDDDIRARQASMRRFNAALVRAMGTDPTTIRIDLDPDRPPRPRSA